MICVHETTTVEANLHTTRAVVRDLQKWLQWNALFRVEAPSKVEFSRDDAGLVWESERAGSILVERVHDEPTLLEYRLLSRRPERFFGWHTTDYVFEFEPVGPNSTQVSWSISWLPTSWMARAVVFLFRRAVARLCALYLHLSSTMLKDHAEYGLVPSSNVDQGEGSGLTTNYLGSGWRTDVQSLESGLLQALVNLNQWASSNGVHRTGVPFVIFHRVNVLRNQIDVTAALPVGRIPEQLPPGIEGGEFNVSRAFRVRHTGPYRHLWTAWWGGRALEQLGADRWDKCRDCFALCLNDLATCSESELQTEFCWPLP